MQASSASSKMSSSSPGCINNAFLAIRRFRRDRNAELLALEPRASADRGCIRLLRQVA